MSMKTFKEALKGNSALACVASNLCTASLQANKKKREKTPSPGAATFPARHQLMSCNFSRKQFEGHYEAAGCCFQERHGSSDFISVQGCKFQQQAAKFLFFSKHHSDYWPLISPKFYIFVFVM